MCSALNTSNSVPVTDKDFRLHNLSKYVHSFFGLFGFSHDSLFLKGQKPAPNDGLFLYGFTVGVMVEDRAYSMALAKERICMSKKQTLPKKLNFMTKGVLVL